MPNGQFGVTTTFGSNFCGVVVSWGVVNYAMGQVITATRFHPQSTSAAWSWTGHAMMHSRSSSTPYPGNVHQIWEVGWNNDGSIPTGINACDNYQTIRQITGSDTGNHESNFLPFSATGTITNVPDVKGVVLRTRMYNDLAREWNMFNTDNLSFNINTIVPSIPGDFDGDGDVDQSNFGHFQACVTGPDAGPLSGGCEDADFDQDNDVDLADFSVFQRCAAGDGVPADPGCM
jgi:hypothetical protein